VVVDVHLRNRSADEVDDICHRGEPLGYSCLEFYAVLTPDIVCK
jgi:hypothetical protein